MHLSEHLKKYNQRYTAGETGITQSGLCNARKRATFVAQCEDGSLGLFELRRIDKNEADLNIEFKYTAGGKKFSGKAEL